MRLRRGLRGAATTPEALAAGSLPVSTFEAARLKP
jgi:hypothetical protein